MKNNLPTFEVDKKGLAKILERRGKAFVITELWQNAIDENVSRIDITLERQNGKLAELRVIDDSPDGFCDLKHAYTLFAESPKKANPLKRGRFDLGEKLVIAVCESASIRTTKGTVSFNGQGRTHSKQSTESGTIFTGRLKMTREELLACCAEIKKLIVPMNVVTTFNGEQLAQRTRLRSFEATLQTEIGDSEGNLRRSPRSTIVEVYHPKAGETATLYEMGVPVVETSDSWHVNVLQRVPLNMDRDNVTAGYLRDIRALTLNAMVDFMSPEDSKLQWVNDALEDEQIEPEAVKEIVIKRYGADAVSYDPSDPEANKIAYSQERQVIHGGAFSKTVWAKIRENEIVKPAGQVTPSAKAWSGEGDPNATAFDEWIPESKWTDGMKRIAALSIVLAKELMRIDIEVRFCSSPHLLGAAAYGSRQLSFNKLRLGASWFDQPQFSEPILSLIIHEFGHEYSSDHLSKEYYHALCDLGARMTKLALTRPELFLDTPLNSI